MPHRQPFPSSSTSKPYATDNAGANQTQTAENLALAVIEANQHWWTLQIEAMQAALAENTLHSKTMLENASKTTDTIVQWPEFYEEKARRYTELMRSELEIATQMFAQFNQLMEQLFSASLIGLAGLKSGAEAYGETSGEGTERRIAARVISFPDRRQSSQQQTESTKSTARSQAQTAKRRKSA